MLVEVRKMIELHGRGMKDASMPLCNVHSLSPFTFGLEYGPPVHGTWNIVHVGMLIPESHQIFVCAQSCLRGVVLTAAEMNATDRFSTVAIEEHNVLDGDLEDMLIEGVSDICKRLEPKPRAMMVYTSCIHHFTGCDLGMIYTELRKRFPEIDFTDCYMTPILRKSGITPDEQMRKQLYSFLKMQDKDDGINIIGNVFSLDTDCEIIKMIKQSGRKLRQITEVKSYDQYMQMGKSSLNIVTGPVSLKSGEELKKRLGQPYIYIPHSYNYMELDENLKSFASLLKIEVADTKQLHKNADEALDKAKSVVGDTPIAIDYTAVTRPLGLAMLLLQHGFNVTDLYLDAITQEESETFYKLKENYPNIILSSPSHPAMRVAPRNEKHFLAIGQKAAYYKGTDNFVNVVENDNMHGYSGICKLCDKISNAYTYKKDHKSIVQIKGWGCNCK